MFDGNRNENANGNAHENGKWQMVMGNKNSGSGSGSGLGLVALYEQFEHFVFHFCSFSRLVSCPFLFFVSLL